MKRQILGLAATLLLVAAPAALASEPTDGPRWPSGPHALVFGKVVSVDATAGTITADVRVPPAPKLPPPPNVPPASNVPPTSHGDAPGSGTAGPRTGTDEHQSPAPGAHSASADGGPVGPLSAPQRVTITTNASTIVRLDDQPSSIANLAPGVEFVAGFNAAPGSSIDQIVAGPAVGINARAPHVFYGFAGTVTSVDKTAGTLTVSVLGTTAAATKLGVVDGQSLAFKLGDHTMSLTLSAGFGHGAGVLSGISIGDVVAAGYQGPAGATLADLLAQPLNVLVDIPVGSGTGAGGTTTQAKSRALKLASRLLSDKRGDRHKTRKGKHQPATRSK